MKVICSYQEFRRRKCEKAVWQAVESVKLEIHSRNRYGQNLSGEAWLKSFNPKSFNLPIQEKLRELYPFAYPANRADANCYANTIVELLGVEFVPRKKRTPESIKNFWIN